MQKEIALAHTALGRRSLLVKIYPWLIWAIGASFFFYKYLLQVSPSVMTNDLMSAFRVNAVGLGNLSASYFYAYLIMQIPVGMLLDRFSPRYMTSFAIFVCAIGTLLFSHAQGLPLAAIARTLIGLGAAFSAISLFKLTAIWFPPKRFAMVSGMCMTAAMLGAIFGQFPLAYAVAQVGWRSTLYLVGALGVALSLFYVCLVKDKAPELATPNVKQAMPYYFRSIFLSKQAWLLSLYSGLAFAPVSVFGGLWGIPFIEEAHHLTRMQAAFTTSFIFIGFALGAPTLGWLSDAIKKRKPVMLYGPLVAVISLCMVLYMPALSFHTIATLLFIFGFSASGFFTSFAMIKDVFPVLLVATALGFMNTFDAICEAISEPLVGIFLDSTWQGKVVQGIHVFSASGYQWALSLLPLYLLTAITILYFIEETNCCTYEI